MASKKESKAPKNESEPIVLDSFESELEKLDIDEENTEKGTVAEGELEGEGEEDFEDSEADDADEVEDYEEDDDMSAEEGDFDFQVLPSDWKPTIEKNVKVVPQDEMLTSDAITTMEYVALISQRSLQIQNGSEIFVKKDTIKYAKSAEEIAKEELKQGKFPLLLKRMIGTTHCEILDPNVMTIPRM